jgi:hypothetical protein
MVNDAIRAWLDIATATALTFDPINDYERGAQAAIRQMRSLHLSGFESSLTPNILDALRRAGLLVDRSDA